MPTRRVFVAVIAAALGIGMTVGTVAAFVGPKDRDPGGAILGKNTPGPRKSTTPSPSRPPATGTASTPPDLGIPTSEPKNPPAKPAKVTIAPGKLKRTEALADYWDAKTKQLIRRDVVLPLTTRPMPDTLVNGDSERTVDNFAFTSTGEPTKMLRLGGDGTSQLGEGIVHGPVVSATHAKFAWTVASKDGGNATLVVSQAYSGEAIHKRDLGFPVDNIEGFLGDRVVLSTPEGTPIIVDPSTGKRDFIKADMAVATAPSAGLIAVLTPLKRGEKSDISSSCADILDGIDGKSLWRDCNMLPVSFSPDGRYAVTSFMESDGLGPSSYQVVDIRSRKTILELRADLVGTVSWGSNIEQGLTLEVAGGGKFSLVTCSLAGKCANIVEPVPFNPDGDPAYVLSKS